MIIIIKKNKVSRWAKTVFVENEAVIFE